jgi:hypothetical protein
MTLGSTHKRLWKRWWLVALSFAACFFLAACGPLGDDDADPTATSESIAVPTEESAATATASESAGLSISTPVAPPPTTDGTPNLEPLDGSPSSAVPVSTPVFNDVTTDASPAAVTDATPVTAEVPGDGADAPLPDGDGTSGAFPASDSTPTDAPLLVTETPSAVDAATLPSSPVALAGSLADLEVLTVSSCEPDNVPVIALQSPEFTTIVDVNVRVGPGADCEALPISPVGAFLPVTVIAGPVQREGEDFVWVQVEVAGAIGWIVTEALEPAAP